MKRRCRINRSKTPSRAVAAADPRALFRAEMGAEVLDTLVAQGATFEPLMIDGALAGAALVNGTEIHFVAAPEWREGRLGKRRVIREFLSGLLAKSELGFLTTRVLNTRTTEQAFVRRVGFQKSWDDGTQTFYMLSAIPFARTST